MKKRFLVLLFFIILTMSLYAVLSHEGEEEKYDLDQSDIFPISQLTAIGYGSLLLGIIIIIIVLFQNSAAESLKKVLYCTIAVITLLVTVYLVVTTIYLNSISIEKGPVHWHADFKIWVCDKEIKIAEPKGLSNRQGTDLVHAHDDDRIHIEGVILDKKSASLGAFFHANGGYISDDEIRVPTNTGLIAVHVGDTCNEKPAKLYVFVNGNSISSPQSYIISPYEKVPPGDRIKIIFTEKTMDEINPNIS